MNDLPSILALYESGHLAEAEEAVRDMLSGNAFGDAGAREPGGVQGQRYARAGGGFELDLGQTAAAMGLTFTPGAANPFARSVNRCVMFGAAQPVTGGLAVRRRLPPVSARQLARMPEYLRDAHQAWHRSGPDDHDVDRARILGRAMLHAGDPGEAIERQLLGLGIAPAVAVDVTDELLGRRLAPT